MKIALIKRIVLSQILILLMTSGYSQKTDSTIVKRTYQTAFAKTAPVIDGLMNDDCWNLVEWSGRFYPDTAG